MSDLGGSQTPDPASDSQIEKPITECNTQSNSLPKPPSQCTSANDCSEADYPPLTAPAAPIGASIAPFRTSKTEPILFYHKGDPYYEFTNFSPHDVIYKGKRYPTSEHLFQAFKFLDEYPEIARKIRKCGEGPMLAFNEARRYQELVRSDWRQVNIEKMEIALYLKFTQHADLKALLLDTGDAEIIEDSARDYFWGTGADRSGRNELGKALMRLRTELREEPGGPYKIPTGRKDDIRLSVQDLPSLISAQSVSSANEPRFEGHEDPKKNHSAGEDNTHHLVQDPEPIPDANGPPCSAALTSGNRAVSPQIEPPRDSGLCEFCQARPKFQTFPYCGRTCAAEASKMCSFCRSKPRFGKHPFCSRTCAAKAGGAV